VPNIPSFVAPGVLRTQIGIMLHNFGLGIAEDVFINIAITSHPGARCKIEFKPSEERDVWRRNFLLNQRMQMITRADVRLPPEADLNPLDLEIFLQSPIERGFSFEGTCGSSGGEATRFQFKVNLADITEACRQFVENFGKHSGTPVGKANDEKAVAMFNRKFFGSVACASSNPHR
jgi:hypothetical protein